MLRASNPDQYRKWKIHPLIDIVNMEVHSADYANGSNPPTIWTAPRK